MEKQFKELNKKFVQIKNMGWIKTIRSGSTGIGATFEALIGTNENNLEIPDYNDIEIKTKRNYSKSYTTLFNCTPEGPHYYEIERLREKYGYPDKILKEHKVINNSIFCNNKTKVNSHYYFQLSINRIEEKILLNIIDINGNLIENDVYWTFDTLKEKLYRKLKNIAFVSAIRKYVDGIEHFKYYKIDFYQLKDFNEFIELIKKGIIRITFKIGVVRTGPNKGKIHDHGTGFDIMEKDILKLYNNYYI